MVDSPTFEISIGPHVRRPDWRVLRVSYPRRAEVDPRIAAALAVLVGTQGVADAYDN